VNSNKIVIMILQGCVVTQTVRVRWAD